VSLGDVSLACAWALVNELVASGMRHACLSPGSRSTPLALALARHPDVELHVHLDERSSSFFAMGIAKSTLRPVAVACTSGTAAAELFPAVVEASQSRLPLVLLTADRPPRLRGTGANQTIDQVGLYGWYARAYLEPPVPSELGDAEAWREAGRDAAEAMHPLPGPVHVNCPFDEPLTPSQDTSLFQTSSERSRPSGRALEATPEEVDRFLELISGARGVALFGGRPTIDDRPARFWSNVLGWPVIAEPTSCARRPGIALAAGQALLGSRWLDDLRPEVVVQFGAAPTTRASQGLVASAPELVVVDRLHLEPDVGSRANLRIHLDPGELVFGGREPMPAPAGWTDTWRRADGLVRVAMDEFLDGFEEPFEPRIARDLAARVPKGGTLFVGNSSPVRDLDLAMAPREGLRVLANRGASGIDGLVSTALGIAASNRGPTFELIGDLSFVHDAGALSWSSKRGIALTIVVLNNAGGELFAQLPQRAVAEHEQLFLTPHGQDLGAMCAAAGVEHERVERSSDLIPALARTNEGGGIAVVEVTIDVERQRHRREELGSAIDAALASEG
jgi:2-succinyl-5-enolpyruvyl-6-hydroxy-3-cyclohexene-1-carboxylate synthase